MLSLSLLSGAESLYYSNQATELETLILEDLEIVYKVNNEHQPYKDERVKTCGRHRCLC